MPTILCVPVEHVSAARRANQLPACFNKPRDSTLPDVLKTSLLSPSTQHVAVVHAAPMPHDTLPSTGEDPRGQRVLPEGFTYESQVSTTAGVGAGVGSGGRINSAHLMAAHGGST